MSPSSSPCRAAFSAALLAFVIHAHPAAAAENAADPEILEEVVVTAWLRSAPLEQVPTSVTVLGRRTLEQAGQQHFEDVIALVRTSRSPAARRGRAFSSCAAWASWSSTRARRIHPWAS